MDFGIWNFESGIWNLKLNLHLLERGRKMKADNINIADNMRLWMAKHGVSQVEAFSELPLVAQQKAAGYWNRTIYDGRKK